MNPNDPNQPQPPQNPNPGQPVPPAPEPVPQPPVEPVAPAPVPTPPEPQQTPPSPMPTPPQPQTPAEMPQQLPAQDVPQSVPVSAPPQPPAPGPGMAAPVPPQPGAAQAQPQQPIPQAQQSANYGQPGGGKSKVKLIVIIAVAVIVVIGAGLSIMSLLGGSSYTAHVAESGPLEGATVEYPGNYMVSDDQQSEGQFFLSEEFVIPDCASEDDARKAIGILDVQKGILAGIKTRAEFVELVERASEGSTEDITTEIEDRGDHTFIRIDGIDQQLYCEETLEVDMVAIYEVFEGKDDRLFAAIAGQAYLDGKVPGAGDLKGIVTELRTRFIANNPDLFE